MAAKSDYIAVITGDIVHSGKLDARQREQLPAKLKMLFSGLPQTRGKQDFSIFRGDSFQGSLEDPAIALQCALWLRAGLMRTDTRFSSYDCRLAIGIGKAVFMASTALESDGEAFRNSGPVLDSMEQEDRLRILSPWESFNQEMALACQLSDVILNRWTAVQAGIIAGTLEGHTQTTIARSLQISQPAVSTSLKTSGWNAIEAFIKRYKTLIQTHCQ